MSYMKGNKTPANPGAAKDPTAFTFPKLSKGELVDMYAFLLETPNVPRGVYDMSSVIWSETGVRLGQADPRNISYIYEPSKVGAAQPDHLPCMGHVKVV